MRRNLDFVEAEDALETLGRALTDPDQADVVVEELAHLESLYRRGSESTRYKVLTELVDVGFSGACNIVVDASPSPNVATG